MNGESDIFYIFPERANDTDFDKAQNAFTLPDPNNSCEKHAFRHTVQTTNETIDQYLCMFR